MQGWSDVPLNETGRKQARRLGERLAGTPVTAVYSSDLSRSLWTADAVASFCRAPILVTPALREVRYGDLEGRTRDEILAMGYGPWWRDWNAGIDVPAPGGETLASAAARADAVLSCVIPRHAGETVVLVAHGGTLRLMICRLMGWPTGEWGRVRIANTGLVEAVVVPGRPARFVRVNDTAHLG